MVDKSCIVLFSGGLDSSTVLEHAISKKYNCVALTIDYSQRHSFEIKASEAYLSNRDIKHEKFKIDLTQIGGSALTDSSIDVPVIETQGIPVTYVPARNTIFLSIASAFCERHGVTDIFIGINQIDYSGYPDCRPEYIHAFEKMINLGTKSGTENKNIKIHSPLVNMTKSQIIKYGLSLGIDYSKTVSCYNANEIGESCGKCDSCRFRRNGFLTLGVNDPTLYKK